MPSFTLTDVAADVWLERFSTRDHDQGTDPSAPWSVTKRTLRGGRRDGVDLIEVDNGALVFSVIPTRGMGLWKGDYRGVRLGWDSPVRDGPVNPSHVNLMDCGGLGWLGGFDELMARCGLVSNGPPFVEGHALTGLHGRIANIPAHFAAVHTPDGLGDSIVVEGRVDESSFAPAQLRMVTRITTAPGSNRLTVADEFQNLGDTPQEMQVLYHWNFGPPLLGAGSRFAAPARVVVPRDGRAAEGVGRVDAYGPPEPGYAEQVYFYELIGEPETGRTLALLRDRDGGRGVALRFDRSRLPAFTLWKNTAGPGRGYVTGLEPGTNFPNPKPFERARGRVVVLPPGGSYLAETTLEVFNDPAGVAAAEAEVRRLQGREPAVVYPTPGEPFAPAGG